MKNLATITPFLGGIKDRYISYQKDRSLEEKFAIAERIEKLDGLELCYPGDAVQVPLLRKLLANIVYTPGAGCSGPYWRPPRCA